MENGKKILFHFPKVRKNVWEKRKKPNSLSDCENHKFNKKNSQKFLNLFSKKNFHSK